jgi:MGT family glycosyltransferase
MATAAFLGFPGYGHIIPSLPLVAELVRRGNTVHYFALDHFRRAIEATGAVAHSYGDMPLGDLSGDGVPLRQIHAFLGLRRWVLEHCTDLVRDLAPDYIVYDYLAGWGAQIAEMLGVPAACSVPVLMVNRRMAYSLPGQVARVFASRLAHPGQMLRNRRLARSIRRTYGVPQPHDYRVFGNPGDLNIVYTSRLFQPYSESFGEDRFVFVGPELERRAAGGISWAWRDERPLVYVSMGTVFNDRPEIFRSCVQAFAGEDVQVIISFGGRDGSMGLGAMPPNVRVAPFVPQIEVLRRASLFVTHGGTNSVYDALSCDVPMVVLAQAADQHWVAHRVAGLGAGVALRKRGFTADVLRRAADEVLTTSSYARAAARVGASMRAAGGTARAADAIDLHVSRASIAGRRSTVKIQEDSV